MKKKALNVITTQKHSKHNTQPLRRITHLHEGTKRCSIYSLIRTESSVVDPVLKAKKDMDNGYFTISKQYLQPSLHPRECN